MDSSFNIPDPSDWLHTPTPLLGPVESALRCQVCKDFFNTPMITSCSHTFCSLCIRRCLTTDGRCPSCRTQDQEVKLRLNPIVQELVDSFQLARPSILQLAESTRTPTERTNHARRKRKLSDTDIEEDEIIKDSEIAAGRRRSQRRSASTYQHADDDNSVDDASDGNAELDDGLSACPICNSRMKEEAVYSHLDIHNTSDDPPKAQTIPTRSQHFSSSITNPRPAFKMTERLPQLNYSLLKENALRRKLLELGIPSGGPRALLIRRHTEWVNLVNANCDSTRPRTKRELLHEIDLWDKTQGRQLLNSSTGGNAASVMNKDFDGAAWAASHDQDFQSLIVKARRKADPKSEEDSGPSLEVPERTGGVTQPTIPPASDHRPGESATVSLASNNVIDIT